MPPRSLIKEHSVIEKQVISVLQAGYKTPQCYSDWQYAVRNLMRMFDLTLRTQPGKLRYPCDACEGIGTFIDSKSTPSIRESQQCSFCKGRGYEEI